MDKITPIEFNDNKLILIDQRKLFENEEYFVCDSIESVYFAIKDMVVRGAPAIGVAAGYGMYIKALSLDTEDIYAFRSKMQEAADYLESSRPTAVNLTYATRRMMAVINNEWNNVAELISALNKEAVAIHNEDVQANKVIGENMLSLLKNAKSVLTVCNAGILATTAYGTATAAMYLAKEQGKQLSVFACETRPRLQGARLTSYELNKNGVDVTVITDGMVAHVMSKKMVDAVITGCDRVASNGDTANKIGTKNISIIAKRFKIPMYIACPTSTIDLGIKDGSEIIIEERDASEVTHIRGVQVIPSGVKVFNPSFDVTDHDDITAIVTEKGIAFPPYDVTLKVL
ncbi:MAG: S-methyl-5-thioribose-1-phosphate isomerase [Clostridia bacterium]|jgi:methylthioribose-1-phosphate isomerase|nr:S-methyl-5-thioribose-1-phosphate isomerase [Clostridia bacterium]NLV33235.1 S-methyl-5-thioribose-1-phosphate isomerase [Clostridiaceae bacterium]MDD4502498.1 S-methyl-5-thioribose-1-phosphate isomerase [Clostridia bacterium]HPB16298.1 S-methyl-5-thioribose-1-phosphate isomerase [Clostridia bacterium]HQM95849.1 S-methyl-5-thioribose-1-phosphate isomerase [Clostridia bacterium]